MTKSEQSESSNKSGSSHKSGVLLSEQRGHIGIITFNRPAQHNALSPELLGELCAVLAGWAASGEVRVLILTGAGDKAFSAG